MDRGARFVCRDASIDRDIHPQAIVSVGRKLKSLWIFAALQELGETLWSLGRLTDPSREDGDPSISGVASKWKALIDRSVLCKRCRILPLGTTTKWRSTELDTS